MMKFNVKQWLFLFFISLISTIVFAAAPQWQIIPNESSITFTGTQNGAPASGKFSKFTGDIAFDPKQLNESKIRIVIDTGSVSTTYSEFTSTLMTSDWLDTKQFPQATFESNQIISVGEDKYQSEGTLTIRDKKIPVTLNFTGKKLDTNKGQIKGSTVIKRTLFGVGQGEWGDTNAVKDEVEVNFTITAMKK